MLAFGCHSGIKSLSTVTLVFRLPYYTKWGQSLVVCGSAPALGSWNVKQGLALSPSHEGDELIWSGKVAVAVGFTCEYSYYVVDDNRNVLRWEAGKRRKLNLPDGVPEGAVVEIRDLWQEASEALFMRSAFKDVIFGGEKSSEASEDCSGDLDKRLDWQDSIVVQFIIRCPRIEDGTSVNVIGSASELGKWKPQDGLRLRYAGDYIWKAECVLRKYEFPLKYPFLYSYMLNLEIPIIASSSF